MNVLLHICCSNCALYPVKIIQSDGHVFSGFWFNPNIHPVEEHTLRLDSLKKLSDEWRLDILPVETYEPEKYFEMFESSSPPLKKGDLGEFEVKTQADRVPSFPERCRACYELRLEKTAEQARALGFEAFTTTLLISPYQDIQSIETIGKALADKYNVQFYFRDFRPYFRKAMTRSRELGLYRQKYCGCLFSREERREKQDVREKR